jgi:small-conductance mechanosensitive channel
MQLSDFTERLSAWLPRLAGVLPVIIVIIVGTYLLNLLVGRALIVLANRTRLTEMDVIPFRQVLRWVTRFLAGILILSVLGFEIGGLWAMLSTILGLVAIGFVAVWSILSHTSATMLILFLHPFQMGDDLEFAGEPVQGRAVDINFFFTTLIDHNGTLHQIPNNLFFQKTLKRRRNDPIISLAAQLNSPDRLQLELPPKPEAQGDGKMKEPDPMMNYPDPNSFMPPATKK